MKENYQDAYFFTAKINNSVKALETDQAKKIITKSLQFAVEKVRAKIWGFVLMPDHIHLGMYLNEDQSEFQKKILGFTAQTILKMLKENEDPILQDLLSTQSDRQYHFWERRSDWEQINSAEAFENC